MTVAPLLPSSLLRDFLLSKRHIYQLTEILDDGIFGEAELA